MTQYCDFLQRASSLSRACIWCWSRYLHEEAPSTVLSPFGCYLFGTTRHHIWIWYQKGNLANLGRHRALQVDIIAHFAADQTGWTIWRFGSCVFDWDAHGSWRTAFIEIWQYHGVEILFNGLAASDYRFNTLRDFPKTGWTTMTGLCLHWATSIPAWLSAHRLLSSHWAHKIWHRIDRNHV